MLMSVNRAKYFLMTGERMTADQAYQLGLINFLVDDGSALDETVRIAEKLAMGAPMAVKASKSGVNQYIKSIANLVLPLTLSQEIACMRSANAEEAVNALKEKRKPNFINR